MMRKTLNRVAKAACAGADLIVFFVMFAVLMLAIIVGACLLTYSMGCAI
jgi:hypothetical protein